MSTVSPSFSTTEKSAGFTLTEMLVVLAIIALVASAAMPMVAGARMSGRPIDAARKIQQTLVAARVSAMSLGRVETIAIDPGDRLLHSSVRNGRTISLPNLQMNLLVGRELIVSREQVDLKFLPDGSSNGIEIELSNKRGDHATVSVNWLTGAISIGDGPND